MADEDELYFPMSGEESHPFLLVRFFSDGGAARADTTLKGPVAEAADFEFTPGEGEAKEVLRAAREFAALRGLDLRIQLDGVEWDPTLGTLIR